MTLHIRTTLLVAKLFPSKRKVAVPYSQKSVEVNSPGRAQLELSV